MIKIYTTPSCSGCRKTVAWLKEHNLDYAEKNLLVYKLNRQEIIEMLKQTEDGASDIISTRSNDFNKIKKKFEDLKLSELIQYIIDNPKILKRPIVFSDEATGLVTGYNSDDLRLFLPKENQELRLVDGESCEECDNDECNLNPRYKGND